MTEAERIAKGLTEAQRRAVLGLTGVWLMRNVKGAGAFRAIYMKGVAEWDRQSTRRSDGRTVAWIVHRLTPLGLEVRKVLEAQP